MTSASVSWQKLTVPFFANEEYYVALQSKILSALGPFFAARIDGPSAFKSNTLFMAAYLNNQDIISHALTIFDTRQLTDETAAVAFWSVAKTRQLHDWQIILEYYSNATDSAIKSAAQKALAGGSRSSFYCYHLMKHFEHNRTIAMEFAHLMLQYNSDSGCRSIGWQFIKMFGKQLLHEQGSSASAQVIALFDGLFSTRHNRVEVFEWMFMLTPEYFTQTQLQNVVAKIDQNIAMLHRNSAEPALKAHNDYCGVGAFTWLRP